MKEEVKLKKQRLIIERVIDSSLSLETKIQEITKYGSGWTGIIDGVKYDLKTLVKQGWEIIDVKVSTSKGVSHSGCNYILDHTILILERTN